MFWGGMLLKKMHPLDRRERMISKWTIYLYLGKISPEYLVTILFLPSLPFKPIVKE